MGLYLLLGGRFLVPGLVEDAAHFLHRFLEPAEALKNQIPVRLAQGNK